MESFVAAAGTMVLVIGVIGALLQLFSAYALQALAEKNELPDFARFLAWIPVLQTYPLIKCGGGDFKKFMLGFAGLMGGFIVLGILAAVVGSGASALIVGLPALAAALGIIYYIGRIMWRTAEMRGVSGWVGLLGMLFFPFAYGYIAFHDGWVAPNKAGLALGALLAFGPLVGQYQMVNTMSQQMEEVLQAAETGDLGELESQLVQMTGDENAATQIQQALSGLGIAMELGAGLATVQALDPGDPQQLESMRQTLENVRGQLEARESELDARTSMELYSQLRTQEARLPQASAETPIPQTAAAPPPPVAPPASAAPIGPPATAGAPYDEILGFAVPASPPCPSGTTLHGAAPPDGENQWCTRTGPDEGMKHGWYTQWNSNGSRALAGEYRDGLRVGVWTRWFPNGVKRVQAEFRDGLQDGILVAWSKQGEKVLEQQFSEGSPANR